MKRTQPVLLAALLSCTLCISIAHAAPAHASPIAQQAAPSRDYVVKAGDTLLAIAVKYGVSMAAIQIANDLADPAMIRAGQSLKIPSEKVHPNESPFWSAYEVKAGDTLGAISQSLGVDQNDLLKVNKLANAGMLQIGQLLIVPVNGAGTTPVEQPQTVATKQPAAPQPQPQTQQTYDLIPLDQPVQGAPAPQPTAVPQAQPPAVQISPQASSADMEAIRQNLLAYYNQARAANGLPALTYSALLQGVAQAHADECAARNQGSHVGLDGSRPSQRITRAGYPGPVTGENWAWARSAEQAFDMWYTQEIASNGPHLQNILSPRYSEVGFGIAANRGGYYLIANFGGQ